MFILANNPSVASLYINELRDISIQSDRLRFRRNMERIGELLAYEISRTFPYKTIQINTPLATTDGITVDQDIVLGTILRAGIPFHQGFLNILDKAENAFVASYRHVTDEKGSFEIKTEYCISPELSNKILILADPMLATGQSLFLAWKTLTDKYGIPAHTHIASIIASKAGIGYIRQHIPEASLWFGAVDDHLNSKSYIVPGLGDAGDLAYGTKL